MNIAVMIPCYNEERTIAKVVADFKKELPWAAVYVFDNNSTDSSPKLAAGAGAQVIRVNDKGKGRVVQKMLENVNADIYVMVDGDDTYFAGDAHKLIKAVADDEADMAVGLRQPVSDSAMRPVNRIGNIFFSALFGWCFKVKLQDILSGYRVFSKKIVRNVAVMRFKFEVESEMTIQALSRGLRIKEIPIAYKERPEKSHSKLRPFEDGYAILLTIVTLFRDLRPLTFFGGIALLFWLGALIYGLVVFFDARVANLFDSIFLTSLFIIGWLFLLIGFAVHTINHRFNEIIVLLKKNTQE